MVNEFDLIYMITISAVINIVITVLFIRIMVWKLGLQRYMRLAQQGATMLGQRSGEVRGKRAVQRQNIQTKTKLATAAFDELPFGGLLKRLVDRAGVTGDELWNLLQDENFIKGLEVLAELGGGLLGKLSKLTSKSDENTQPQNINRYGT